MQDQAASAVISFIADDDVLADGGFDDECIESTAGGLPDDLAQDVVDDNGRIDLDVDDRDRDDVYDFYNCADERDLARAIADDIDIDETCLEDVFEADDIGDIIDDIEADDPSRFGDFDALLRGQCGTIEVSRPQPEEDQVDVPAPTTTTPPATTTPPTTTTTTTVPPTTTTTTTSPPTPPPPAEMPADATPQLYADETESFLNDNPEAETALGEDISGAQCANPSHIDVGANYICFAQGTDSGAIQFDVVIDAVDSFSVEAANPAFSGSKMIFVRFLIDGLIDENLQVDQFCLIDVVDSYSDADIDLVVANIDAADLPPGVSFDEDELANDLVPCIVGTN